MTEECPFCHIVSSDVETRILLENDSGIVIKDGFPLTLGHTLILTKRHVPSFFEVSDEERSDLFQLMYQAKNQFDKEYKPDAYNIGINDGVASGQTVPHLHIHLIPRYQGDVQDPRGGVRWIMPCKAVYWHDD